MKKLKAIKVPEWLLGEVGAHVDKHTEHAVLLACIVLGVRQLNGDPSLLSEAVRATREPRKGRGSSASSSVPPSSSVEPTEPVVPEDSPVIQEDAPSPPVDEEALELERMFG